MGTTRHCEHTLNPEYRNQSFAFTKYRLQGGILETMVKDMKSFNLGDIPTWFPPYGPLAPRWYRLEDRSGVKVAGELPLTVWMWNQDDDAFPVAWHSDAAADLAPADKNRNPEAYAKAVLGNFVLRTTVSKDILFKG
ncbi:hypothetical protein D5086_014411 [Populus alba]|uniref:Uncharacterized protein n=1 Tax=Populus alba TaxID=43335 RepID=A0ACC4BY83_POPAL